MPLTNIEVKPLTWRVLEARGDWSIKHLRRATHIYLTHEFLRELLREDCTTGGGTILGLRYILLGEMPENAVGKEFFIAG